MTKLKKFTANTIKDNQKIKGGHKGDRVSLVGFGSFSTSKRAAKTGK